MTISFFLFLGKKFSRPGVYQLHESVKNATWVYHWSFRTYFTSADDPLSPYGATGGQKGFWVFFSLVTHPFWTKVLLKSSVYNCRKGPFLNVNVYIAQCYMMLNLRHLGKNIDLWIFFKFWGYFVSKTTNFVNFGLFFQWKGPKS